MSFRVVYNFILRPVYFGSVRTLPRPLFSSAGVPGPTQQCLASFPACCVLATSAPCCVHCCCIYRCLSAASYPCSSTSTFLSHLTQHYILSIVAAVVASFPLTLDLSSATPPNYAIMWHTLLRTSSTASHAPAAADLASDCFSSKTLSSTGMASRQSLRSHLVHTLSRAKVQHCHFKRPLTIGDLSSICDSRDPPKMNTNIRAVDCYLCHSLVASVVIKTCRTPNWRHQKEIVWSLSAPKQSFNHSHKIAEDTCHENDKQLSTLVPNKLALAGRIMFLALCSEFSRGPYATCSRTPSQDAHDYTLTLKKLVLLADPSDSIETQNTRQGVCP